MGALGRFLLAAARLAKQGVKEGDILNQAKKEFGEVSEFMRAKIRKFYKDKDAPSIKNPPKKEGEVIEASFKPGADKRGKIVEESPSQASGIMKTDEASPLMKNIEDVKQNIKGMSENNPKTFRMSEEERRALGYPNRMIEGIIRTAAREILSKKGIDVSKADPIDTFADIFGVNALERLEDVSDELLSAQDYNQLNSILQKNELYDVTPKSGLNLKQSDEIEELTEFDPTDRKPNAMGGRIGFADGPGDPKKLIKKIPKVGKVAAGVESLIKTINKKFGKGTIKTADEIDRPQSAKDKEMFEKFEARNPSPSRQLTDEEIRDYELELGDSETWLNKGTFGEAEQALKNQKAYEAKMFEEYKSIGGSKRAGGPKDPVAEAIDNVSPGFANDMKYDAQLVADDLAEKRFGKEFYDLDQNQQMDLYDEAYQALSTQRSAVLKKKRELIPESIKEGVDDVMRDTSPAGLERSLEVDDLMLKYPGINRDLAKQIANDPDPKRKADVISMIEQTFKMDEMGMSGDEIIDTFRKKTDRTKQANGGLSYLMGM
jgi:hypothetical protein